MADEWATQFNSVTKRFGQRLVLDGVDFRVARPQRLSDAFHIFGCLGRDLRNPFSPC